MILLALAVIALLSGCASIKGTIDPAEPAVGTGAFRAGAASADLTPPPGYSMAGYSSASQVARGSWGRLHARAVYLEDANGHGVCFVACDLWGIPGALADRVAERVRRDPRGHRLGREQIVLSASHTHNGPGNYLSCPLYNLLGSSEAGFDKRLFGFLSDRISSAVLAAVEDAEPVTLRRAEAPAPLVAHNRSLRAAQRDTVGFDALLKGNAGIDIDPDCPAISPDAFRAIDPGVTVLTARSVSGSQRIVAVLGFFSVHPTAMGPTTAVYSADLFGVAAHASERALAEGEHAPVVAILNGPEGDVSPNWNSQDRVTTLRLGHRLASVIDSLARRPGADIAGPISSHMATVSFDKAAKPIMGAGAIGGAEDGLTSYADLWWHEGPESTHYIATQRPKQEPFLYLQGNGVFKRNIADFMDLAATNRHPLVTLHRVGALTIATLPGEFTTLLGARIRRTIAGESGASPLLVGLAHEYVSYFTTPEEFDAQHYEGASMLFGRDAGVRVDSALAALARESQKPPGRAIRYRYQAGIKSKFAYDGDSARNPLQLGALTATPYALVNILGDPGREYSGSLPWMLWIDHKLHWPPPAQSLASPIPHAWIEAAVRGNWLPVEVGGEPQTDDAFRFINVGYRFGDDFVLWKTIWIVPPKLPPGGIYRIVCASDADGLVRKSAPFRLQDLIGRDGRIPVLTEIPRP